MALIGNHSVLNKTPGRLFSGATISGTRSNWGKSGARMNKYYGYALLDKLSNTPPGYLPPYTNSLPLVSGGMSSHNDARMSITALASGALGSNATGSTSIGFTVTGTGGLIISATGAASFALSTNGSILAVLFAVGSASFGFTQSASMNAIGHMMGSTSFAVNGVMQSYAIGFMIGSTTSESLTANSIAAAVWGALTTSNNDAGSMGEALGNAGGAANPWSELLDDNEISGSFGEFVQKLLTRAQFIGLQL